MRFVIFISSKGKPKELPNPIERRFTMMTKTDAMNEIRDALDDKVNDFYIDSMFYELYKYDESQGGFVENEDAPDFLEVAQKYDMTGEQAAEAWEGEGWYNVNYTDGGILIWYPVLGRSFELSSMGIRVDKESLLRQLEIEEKQDREKLYFHKQLLEDKLPLSIGGGIGQSRLCMVMLHKAHIGEIQASIWPEDMRMECARLGMPLI